MYPDAEDLRWESCLNTKKTLDDSPKLKSKDRVLTHKYGIQLLLDVLQFDSESSRLGKLIQGEGGGPVWVGRVLVALVVHRGRPAAPRSAGRHRRFRPLRLHLRRCVSEHRTVLARRRLDLREVKRRLEEPDVTATFAIVLVHVHRLALAEGAEGHHVFMRVEGDGVQRCGVAELRVDRHLVPWGGSTGVKQSENVQSALLFEHLHSHPCLCSKRTPSRLHCQRR